MILEWFIDILIHYGPVGFIFAIAGLSAWLWFVMHQLNNHEIQCQDFRKEVREADAEIKAEISQLRTETVEKDTRLDGKIDTVIAIVKRIERDGHDK